jgi:chromosome segregation ATPase
LDKILTTKNREIDEAHKLYSDARISVLGYRAQILKIRGEHLIKDEEEEHKMIGIGQIEQQKFQEVKKDLETRLQQFQVEYSDAMTNLQAQQKENQELHQHYQTQIYNLRGELERVKTTPVPAPRTNQPRESAQMEQLQKENRTLQNQLERAKQTQRQYEAIRNEYEELKEKHEYINEEVSNHKQQIRDMHYEVQGKMRELSSKDREIMSLKSQVEQLQQQPPLPSMAIGGADDRGGGGGSARMRRQLNDEIGKKNDAIRERDKLRNELEQYRSKDLGQLEEMQQQLYQSAQDYQSLKSQQDKLRSEKAQLKSEKAQLEEQLQEKDKELLDVNTLKEANEQFQVDIQNSKEAIHSLEVELSRKQSQIEQLKKDSDEDKSWEGLLDEMEKELTRIQHESTQLKQLNRQYEKDIEEWKTAKANVDAKLDKKLKDCKEYIDQATLWKEQVNKTNIVVVLLF